MHSAPDGFYFQATNGSVALPAAGYNYNSDWTPLLAGLAPAGMAASLAAPETYVRLSRIRLVWAFSLSRVHHAIFVVLCCFILCSTRAASILPSRPHITVAVAHSDGQGRRF